MWTIHLSKKTEKYLDRLTPKDRERIVQFLYQRVCFHENPYDLGEPLTGTLTGYIRFRCEDYRIISKIEHNSLIVSVVKVGHRRDVYQTVH